VNLMPDDVAQPSVPGVYPKAVNGLDSFLRIVSRIQDQWTEASPDRILPWFRGHSDVHWALLPGLYRTGATARDEYQFRDEFRLRAHPYLSETTYPPVTDWDWYFLMQHYGLPTRLMDWTESSLVGLFFAVREPLDRIDGCVWMLDPWAVARSAGLGDLIFDHLNPRSAAHLPPVWGNEPLPDYPITMQPSFNSRRITAQRGMFTIHGSSRKPLESDPSLAGCLTKIIVRRGAKDRLREQLSTAGISECTVFPELSGLCRELLNTWQTSE
jgi:FRG domain